MGELVETAGGWAEVPQRCPAGHTEVVPAWGACEWCDAMGRQWRCQRSDCGLVTQAGCGCRS